MTEQERILTGQAQSGYANNGGNMTEEQEQQVDLESAFNADNYRDNPDLQRRVKAINDLRRGRLLEKNFLEKERHKLEEQVVEGKFTFERVKNLLLGMKTIEQKIQEAEEKVKEARESAKREKEESERVKRALRQESLGERTDIAIKETPEATEDINSPDTTPLPPDLTQYLITLDKKIKYQESHFKRPLSPEEDASLSKLTSAEETYVNEGRLPPWIGVQEKGHGTPHSQFEHLKKFLEAVKRPDGVERVADMTMPYVRLLQDVDKEKYEQYKGIIQAIKDPNADFATKRDRLNALIQELQQFYSDLPPQSMRPEREKLPESLEELIEIIMRSEGGEWQTGNEKELIDINRHIVMENFVAWIRKQMLFYHDFDPTAEINLFSAIQIPMLYRSISFQEMIYHTRYFKRRVTKQVIMPKRENAEEKEAVSLTDNVEDADYEKLKNQLIYEVWLFNTSRNYNVKYSLGMGSDENLPKLIGEMYSQNIFTRSNHLERVFTLPSISEDNIIDRKEKQKAGDKEEEVEIKANHGAGDLTRTAFLAYYHLADIEMVKKVLGEDSVFFQKTYFDTAGESAGLMARAVSKTQERTIKTGKRKEPTGENWNKDWFENGEEGKLVEDREKQAKFIDYMNIWRYPMQDPNVLTEVRERIRQSLTMKILPEVRKKYEEKFSSIVEIKNKDLSLEERKEKLEELLMNRAYSEAVYAEQWAFTMQRWTGAAAKNDTNAVGFDAWTKVQRTKDYRLRQARGTAIGETGNIYNLGIFKGIGTDFFTGVLTLDVIDENGKKVKKTPLEVLMEAQLSGDDKQVSKVMGQLRFLERTMTQFHADHVNRTFEVFHSLIGAKEPKLDEIAKLDPFRGVVFDQAKFQEQLIEGYFKPMRYAYNTWRGVDFSKKVRVVDLQTVDEKTGQILDKKFKGKKGTKEMMIAHEVPLVNALFGKEVIERYIQAYNKKFGKDYKEGEIPQGVLDFIQDESNRPEFWKNVALLRMSADIYSHRDLTSPYPWLNMAQTEAIIAALRKIPGHIIVDEEDLSRTTVDSLAFNKEDIDWLRKKSRTTSWDYLRMEGSTALGEAGLKGGWDALKTFWKGTFSGGK